jgi:hypothetical protein
MLLLHFFAMIGLSHDVVDVDPIARNPTYTLADLVESSLMGLF